MSKSTSAGMLYHLDCQFQKIMSDRRRKADRHWGKPGFKPMRWKFYPRDRALFKIIDINDGFY